MPVKRDDLPETIDLTELVAQALEEALVEKRHRNDRLSAIVVSKLEEAALWVGYERDHDVFGDNALLDRLREI